MLARTTSVEQNADVAAQLMRTKSQQGGKAQKESLIHVQSTAAFTGYAGSSADADSEEDTQSNSNELRLPLARIVERDSRRDASPSASPTLQHQLMTEELALAEKYAFLNNGCSDLPIDMLSELNTIAAVSNAHKEQQEKVAGNYKAWLGGAEAADVQLQEFSGETTHAESPKHALASMGRGLPVEHNVTNARWSKALDAKMLAEEALIMSRCPNLNNGCAIVDDGDLVYADESVLVKTADAALQHRLIAEEHAAMEKVAFLNNGCSDLALDMETELHSLAAAVSSANLIKTAGNYGDWVDSAAVADVAQQAPIAVKQAVRLDFGRGVAPAHVHANNHWAQALDAKIVAEEQRIMQRCPYLNTGCAYGEGDSLFSDEE